jgi:hypothetical protein
MDENKAQIEARINMAKTIFIQMEKALASRKLFSKEHASYKKTGLELFEKFKRYITTFEELTCIVGEYDFYIEKQSVYKNNDPYESVPFKLYRDGIRRLTFATSLAEQEFLTFIDLVEANYDISGLAEESLQTELWKQNFQTIHYFSIEGISDKEKLGESFEYELDGYFEEFANYINKGSLDQVKLKEVKSLMVDREAFLPEELIKDSPMEIVDDAELAQASSLDENEATQIMTAVQQIDEKVVLNKFVLILFHLLEYPDLAVDNEILAELFQKIAVFYIRQGEIQRVIEIIGKIRKAIIETQLITKENYIKFIQAIDFDESMEAIKTKPPGYWAKNLKALYFFLTLFPKSKSNDIYEQLFDAEQMTGCENVFFALMRERGKESVPFLASVFLGKDKNRSSTAFKLLQEINSPETVELLMASIEQANDTLRMSIFKLVENSANSPPEVWSVFLRDKSYRIRKMALHKLIQLQGRNAFPILQTLIEESVTEDRSLDERKELFQIAARLSEKQFLPYLSKIMTGSSLFATQNKLDEKICALEALSMMRATEAESILKKAARSWNFKLRKKAKLAYAKFLERNQHVGRQANL